MTVNNERRKIALIQLCSSQGLCALVRVCKFSKIPQELRTLLEDPAIIKVGVTPHNDASYLLQDYAIKMNGTYDLRFLALMAKEKAEGLGRMSKSVLNIELNKDWRVRCSDWEIEKMSQTQIDYAALDAFVAVEIFRKLYSSIRSGVDLEPDSIRRFCDNYTDITFKSKLAQLNLDPANCSDRKLLKRQNATKEFKRAYSTRSTPLYDNCLLQAPDGDLLCTCDRQKADWYITKGLGVEIPNESSYTVRLNFEPAGRAVGEVGEYYRTAKENRCVVCGNTEDLIRKNVVPHEYRKFFPAVMKDKTSHDVVLLCINCHRVSNICDVNVRQMLNQKCDAPLDLKLSPEEAIVARQLASNQRYARALLTQKKIPEKRREELKEVLKQSYPDREITEEFLENLLTMDVLKPDNTASSHGELVVKRYRETVGLVKLETLWREHFLNIMQPKFMPLLWDVNHNGNRLEIRANEGRVEADDLKDAGVDTLIVPKVASAVEASTSGAVNGSAVKAPVTGAVNESIIEAPSSGAVNESAIKSPVTGPANDNIIEASGSQQEPFQDNDQDDADSTSDWEYRSAAGSSRSSAKLDLDRTLTEDERYFSDVQSVQSFYETIRSDGSTIDDFQSFASSLTERPFYDSDESRSSLDSPNFLVDSDTEVEDEQMGKMEL